MYTTVIRKGTRDNRVLRIHLEIKGISSGACSVSQSYLPLIGIAVGIGMSYVSGEVSSSFPTLSILITPEWKLFDPR